MVDYSKLPDVGFFAVLVCAFASVSHQNRTPVFRLWFFAWIMVLLHFIAQLFRTIPDVWGVLATFLSFASPTWAGVLFMWASIPYRKQRSSPLMFAGLLLINTLYAELLLCGPAWSWALNPAALLFCLLPLSLTLYSLNHFQHPLRWLTVLLYSSLAVFLLVIQHRPDNSVYYSDSAIQFAVFMGCAIHFLWMYRRASTGTFVTITGFFAWASVFIIAPMLRFFKPQLIIENEVWNLPAYMVAVGMLLLLLEDQVDCNLQLALHDALTGLPNRRLFQDRMANALERCRRSKTEMALMAIDLNGFKKVNDTFGHHVGDLLLQKVASVFSERVRRSDTLARTGGDEFSVILEKPITREVAEHVGFLLQQMLKDPLDLGERKVSISASIGVAIFPTDASDFEQLCIAADKRMYETKRCSQELIPNIFPTQPLPIPDSPSDIRIEIPHTQ